MRNNLLSIAAFSMLLFISCGEVRLKGKGSVVTTERQTGSFSSIDIAAPVKAIITIQEGAPTLNLTGYENLLKHIRVTTKDNKLTIELEEGVNWNSDQQVTANITLPSLQAIELEGAVQADVKGTVTGSKLDCDMSGGTQLKLQSVQTAAVNVEISGAGDFRVEDGHSENVSYEISGSGKVYAYGLQANNVSAGVSGAGFMQLTALKKLKVDITGAGNISYKGNPAIQKEVTGAGALHAAN
ncbi:MAG TPA: head GIN domain-containing protein [Flavipsychrobacter sp.]|nr:head GIN domain-containing protein [Flavipsychrobacter sp.]